jgi:hypothetical protein
MISAMDKGSIQKIAGGNHHKPGGNTAGGIGTGCRLATGVVLDFRHKRLTES